MKITKLEPKFSTYIPNYEDMVDGELYISITFLSASHRCACGCGLETVTPLIDKDGWDISYSPEKGVSLSPSIGNFQYPCKSHYFIKNNQIEWV
jgi:hypothetical protein